MVNLTSGTPGEARRTAEWASAHGIPYLDGAIMAVPSMIGGAETLIFYGGSREAFERSRPILSVLGGNAVYLGEDPGVPLVYDLALLTMLYGAWYGYFHALAMLRTAGVSAAAFLPYAETWLRHVIAPALTDPREAAALDAGNFATDESNLTVNCHALNHIVNASTEAGIPADWLIPIRRIAAQKVAEGYGQDAFTRVFEAIAPLPFGQG